MRSVQLVACIVVISGGSLTCSPASSRKFLPSLEDRALDKPIWHSNNKRETEPKIHRKNSYGFCICGDARRRWCAEQEQFCSWCDRCTMRRTWHNMPVRKRQPAAVSQVLAFHSTSTHRPHFTLLLLLLLICYKHSVGLSLRPSSLMSRASHTQCYHVEGIFCTSASLPLVQPLPPPFRCR